MNTSYRSPRRVMFTFFRRIHLRRGMAWGIMILCALLAFEIFNYSTTEFALLDVLGDLRFAGIRWATILALAFCGIDFAGIARLFTPAQGRDEPTEVWYLFGAWLLAASMNAMLTWWGVSVAIASHSSQSSGVVIASGTLTRVVPVFVAIMVWLIRVLIIGTFSVAGERIFSQVDERRTTRSIQQPAVGSTRAHPSTQSAMPATFRPVSKTTRSESVYSPRPEPTYHKLPYATRSARESESIESGRRS